MVALALALILAGCGERAPVTNTPSEGPGEPTREPVKAKVAEDGPAVTAIDVDNLPTGHPPQVDAVVGSTLFHEGKAIKLKVARKPYPTSLGTYDGDPYVMLSDQPLRVSPDGSLTPIGKPHRSVSMGPDAFTRLVPETGHLLVPYFDRYSSRVTVVDLLTGRELVVVDEAAEVDQLSPADKVIVRFWFDDYPYEKGGALSPNKSVAIKSLPEVELPGSPALEVLSLTGEREVVHRFEVARNPSTNEVRISEARPVFEDDKTFLFTVLELREDMGDDAGYFIVRCTLAGACERTGDIAVSASIAGSGGESIRGGTRPPR